MQRRQFHRLLTASVSAASFLSPVLVHAQAKTVLRAGDQKGGLRALLEDKRRNGGGFRLKIRIHPDGPLIGWDLERGIGTGPDGSKFHHAGGDFQGAYIYQGQVLRKGWFIHPKTGERIETVY